MLGGAEAAPLVVAVDDEEETEVEVEVVGADVDTEDMEGVAELLLNRTKEVVRTTNNTIMTTNATAVSRVIAFFWLYIKK